MPHDLRVFDRSPSDTEADDLEVLTAARPDVVGLSAYLWNLPRVTRLVAKLRSVEPRPLIVVGGPSAAGFADVAPAGVRPDVLVIGYGEAAFADILQAHAAGELDTQPRVIRAAPVADLDRYASPYLDGVVDLGGRKTIYIETDRGCPYSCAFCIESTAPPKVARFSLGRIEAELRWALAAGVEQVELCSAIFNLDTAWLERFVKMVERIDPEQQLAFSAALFTTHLDERQAALFGRLRLKSALFGLNTIYRPTFKGVRRAINPDRFREKIELFARHARPQVSLIMGLPGDTPQGLAQTLAFADTLPADVMMFRFMVLPNTLYYEQRRALRLEIDFERDNRILSTHSYTHEDLLRMESAAAVAGFDEINAGEWVRRESQDRFRPSAPMATRQWNALYRILQAMQLDERTWAEWKHVRVFLDPTRYAGTTFESPTGARAHIYAAARAQHPAPFHRTRYFELSHRGADAPALLEAFAEAFDGCSV